jgi:hypothetical protein
MMQIYKNITWRRGVKKFGPHATTLRRNERLKVFDLGFMRTISCVMAVWLVGVQAQAATPSTGSEQ